MHSSNNNNDNETLATAPTAAISTVTATTTNGNPSFQSMASKWNISYAWLISPFWALHVS